MEFVSRKQMSRSAHYRRPVVRERHPAVRSSAFGVQVQASSPVQHVAVQTSSVNKADIITATSAVQPKQVTRHTLSTANSAAQLHKPQVSIMHKTAARSAVSSSSTGSKILPNELEASKQQPDLTTIFNTISMNEIAEARVAKSVRLKQPVEHEVHKTSKKKKAFNVAIFVAAVVGMVAMGYDLFMAPHSKPSVSNISMQKEVAETIATPKKQVSLASYTTEPKYPKWLAIPSIKASAPIHAASVPTVTKPKDGSTVDWLKDTAQQAELATVVLVGDASSEGILAHVKELKEGATFELERGDSARFVYRVDTVETQKTAPSMEQLGVSDVVKQPKLKLVGVVSKDSYIIVSTVQL